MRNISTNSPTFTNSVACQPEEQEQPQSSVFSNKETLTNIQKQDTTQSNSFHVPGKPLLQQGTQQFLLDNDSLAQERSGTTAGTLVGIGQMDNSPQHQLSLLPPDEVAQLEQAVRQLQAKGFCSIQLHSEESLAKKQQHHLQQKQIQQQQLHQQQMQQQQQAMENLQHHLFHPQVPMQCSREQQGSSQGMVENSNTLFQQPPPQQQQQQQQQAVMYHQAKDLMSMQSGFLQQAASHSSSPMFHTSNTLAEAQSPQEALFHTQKTSPTQEQVQASLFQSTMNVLDGSNLTAEPQHSATSIFLPQNALPGQLAGNNNQPQQLAFLNSMQTSGLEPQSVFQTTSQLSSIQESTPMEQQSPQQASQTPPGSLFQSIQQSPNNKHPAGLLYNSLNTGMSPEQQSSSLMFTGQSPMNTTSLISPEQQNPSLSYPQNGIITVRQDVPSEPMSFQDQSTVVDNQSVTKQQMFQEQQPMQLAPGSGTGSQAPVNLFLAQPDMPRMPCASQHASQEVLFAAQSSVTRLQTTTSSPVQQPGSLFQTTVNGSLSQSNQNQRPNLFLYEIQNGKYDKRVQSVKNLLVVRAGWTDR